MRTHACNVPGENGSRACGPGWGGGFLPRTYLGRRTSLRLSYHVIIGKSTTAPRRRASLAHLDCATTPATSAQPRLRKERLPAWPVRLPPAGLISPGGVGASPRAQDGRRQGRADEGGDEGAATRGVAWPRTGARRRDGGMRFGCPSLGVLLLLLLLLLLAALVALVAPLSLVAPLALLALLALFALLALIILRVRHVRRILRPRRRAL